MKIPRLLSLIFLFLIRATDSNAQVLLQQAFPNLSFDQPLGFQHPGDGTDRIFVATQPGVVYVFNNSPSVTSAKVFLDLRDRVTSGGELGFLGLAFHPDYKNNGYFYVNYTTSNPLRSVIARYTVSPTDPDAADKNSELILFQVNQPFANHNGGQLAFGPDGYLYIGLGDGGSAGDPQNNAQNNAVLLGKLLRIDVNAPPGGGTYSIPRDNPFVGNTSGYREEIYAYGLRNPWRFSFDPATGRLWAADVGQDLWEEIDLIEKGKNYGWRIMEGNHCFDPPSGCNTAGLTPPIWEYGHNSEGGEAVIGGYVYRGAGVPELFGKYIYGDFVSGRIWALTYDGVNPPVNTLLLNSGLEISSFGVDQHNELYVCAFDGKIYKFTSATPPPPPTATPTPIPDPDLIQRSWGIFGDTPVPQDYDGDAKADLGVWRPLEGRWYLLPSAGGFSVQSWGLPGDTPVPADYDGDRKADLAVFRSSQGAWFILNSLGGTRVLKFGRSSDQPVPQDYDGDGLADLAIFRPSQGGWGIKPSGGGSLITVRWGLPGDVPVPGDYDGDGKADVAVWRPGDGTWYIVLSGGGIQVRPWGQNGDIPVVADYDGDGKADLAVWRPGDGTWYLIFSSTGAVSFRAWGVSGDKPVPGDYNGDGKADLAVWRPGDGTWWIALTR